jgi:hypothetical protein
MPKLLHESQGLRIVQNDKNGFAVATLHFTADPRKRGETWIAESKKGLKAAKWEQEFNISYDAMLGEKVFPELMERRQDIIVRSGPYLDNDWPKDLPMWGGFDYGQKNPSSFHVYTIKDGVTYALWEMYGPCKNIFDFVEQMKACPFFSQIRYIAHDPDMTNLKMRDMKTGAVTSVRQQFEQLGVTKWLSGNRDEQAWLVTMQKHWMGEEVTFKILECCPQLINELQSATYVSMSERQLETQNYKEAMVDKNNHAMDDLKYFMNSSPNERTRPLKLPNLASSYIGAPSAPKTHQFAGANWWSA